MDKQTMKEPRKCDEDKNRKTKVTVRSGKKHRATVSSNKPLIKQVLVRNCGSDSTPVPSSRTTRMQKIRKSGAKSLVFRITVYGLKKF